MLSYGLDVALNGISFLIEVLLAKAENHVHQEEGLHEVVKVPEVFLIRHSKSWVQSISENVIARHEEHQKIEGAFPRAVFFDDQKTEYALALLGVAFVLAFKVLDLVDLERVHIMIYVFIHFLMHDLIVKILKSGHLMGFLIFIYSELFVEFHVLFDVAF